MTGSLLITVNVHGIGPEAASTPEAELFGRDAHGRYTYRIGLARLLDALRDDGLPATFFWPGTEAEKLPHLVERCLRDGHEIASHGRPSKTTQPWIARRKPQPSAKRMRRCFASAERRRAAFARPAPCRPIQFDPPEPRLSLRSQLPRR